MSSYKRENNQLKQQIIDIAYFMHGGITWEEAWELSFTDRDMIVKTINRHLKEESGSKKEMM